MRTGTSGVVVALTSRDVLDGLDDGQAVYVAGEVFAVRRDSTPGAPSATARLQDLSAAVVVFPAPIYRECGAELDDGAFLRIDGRVRRDGDETVVVAVRVVRDRPREGDFPALVDAAYVIGLGLGGLHAIAHTDAAAAVTAANGDPAQAEAFPVCGQGVARVVPKWGAFARGNPSLVRVSEVCPACAWGVAVATGDVAAELDALCPAADEVEPRRRLLGDPLIARHLCEAIIAAAGDRCSGYELDHPRTVQLLAAVTAHAPVLLVPEECAEDPHSCDHRPDDLDWDDESWRCSYPEASVGCPACSVRAGGWAGEWQGQYLSECTVASPCQVLRTLAAQYRVPLGAEPTEAAWCAAVPSDEQRAHWRWLADIATPGPWRASGALGPGPDAAMGVTAGVDAGSGPVDVLTTPGAAGYEVRPTRRQADAELTAAARTALPQLLAAVTAAENEIARLRAAAAAGGRAG